MRPNLPQGADMKILVEACLKGTVHKRGNFTSTQCNRRRGIESPDDEAARVGFHPPHAAMADEPLNRSTCALLARTAADGDNYTCSGCGTSVLGFGRWRNHMKRSKKHKGWAAPPVAAAASNATAAQSTARTAAYAKLAPVTAASSGTGKEDSSEPEEKKKKKKAHRGIPKHQKEAAATAGGSTMAAAPKQPKEEGVAPKQPKEAGATGKRWIGDADGNGKRQRKFF